MRARIENDYQDLIKEPIVDLLLKIMLCSLDRKRPKDLEYIENSLEDIWGTNMAQRNSAYDRMQDGLFCKIDELKLHMTQKCDAANWHRLLTDLINFLDISRIKARFPTYKQGTYFEELVDNFETLFWSELDTVKGDWKLAIENFCGLHSIPIMTIHKSKGLEYSAVYFIGLEDSAFWNFRHQPEEDRCTFFVALSRARSSVAFSYCKCRSNLQRPFQRHDAINEFFDLLQKPGMADVKEITE